MTDDEYKNIKKKPHYLYVVNLKTNNNKCWGFLCVDSNELTNISDDKKKKIKLLVAEHANHLQHLISLKTN
ncbi:hypothetical protein Enr10x_47490 [Gimesia panareensis]|uniref:Uncharacterized protein n=2 Tax=Gimesia panareensis TaxID=2527978 RepID=A0A517QCN7_9PLAN|nr:hypothetical protein Enr10x_47490 [Gimesia panareensis]QDU52439.1 hypothetical protein Pan110_48170 [Gimesia panareensis]